MPKRIAPGPKGHLLLGNIPEFLAEGQSFQRRVARVYGGVASIRLSWSRAYLISEPDTVRELLLKEETGIYGRPPFYRVVFGRFLGESVLTTEGAAWRRRRELIQPAFHHQRIATYADLIVEHTERLLRRWQPGQEIDQQDDMIRLTLGIIARTLFGHDVEDKEDSLEEILSPLVNGSRTGLNNPFITLPLWVPTPENRRQKRAVRRLNDMLFDLIRERRKTNEDRGDLLSMLMLTRDSSGNPLTDQEVRDEAATIVGAGHETIAGALTWVWYLLSLHPEVEAKLHAELERVLGERRPTFADVSQLEYTAMVVKEAMRMYAPVPAYARQARKPTVLGGYDVLKGMIVFIGIDVMHHDPRWFDAPDEFRPERFTKENEKRIPRYAYLPFGGGPHICIGNSFAMMEAILVLATIAQQYRLRLVPGQTVKPESLLTQRPADPLMMRLEPREVVKTSTAARHAELDTGVYEPGMDDGQRLSSLP